MKDGGPAFPIYTPDMNLGDTAGPGMTLLDYFAAHAMHEGMRVLFAAGYANLNAHQLSEAARAAYMAADAMLAERHKVRP